MTLDLTSQIESAAVLLRQGGIVAYPTETFYGLGALASARPALERLTRAKLRPLGKALALLAADRAMLGEVVAHFDPVAESLAARFWPGPLTLVLPAVAGLSSEITAGGDTVGVRVPGSDIARALSREAGGVLVATSANLSGAPPVVRASDLDRALVDQIDGVLDGGITPGGLPSTVVSVSRGGCTLIRPGAIAWEEILPLVP